MSWWTRYDTGEGFPHLQWGLLLYWDHRQWPQLLTLLVDPTSGYLFQASSFPSDIVQVVYTISFLIGQAKA